MKIDVDNDNQKTHHLSVATIVDSEHIQFSLLVNRFQTVAIAPF